MSLSSDLISQFVKVTKAEIKEKDETTVYGTTVVSDGTLYVKLDGSELLTPVSTTAVAVPGERVRVAIKNHTAVIVGNMDSPAARAADVTSVSIDVASKITEFEIAIGNKVSTDSLDAQIARIDILESDNVTIKSSLTARDADISDLKSDNVIIHEQLTANAANIQTLESEKIDVTVAEAKYATIANLDATNATLHNLESTYGDFAVLTTGRLDAIDATLEDLNVGDLSAKYANLDFSNIGKAAMEYLYSESGLINNVVIGDGSITGELVGVTIKGDLIEGNTVVADKLVIKGEDGLFYKLNTDGLSAINDANVFNRDICYPEENVTNVEWIDDNSATVTMGSTELVAMYFELDPEKTYVLSYEGENCGIDIFGPDWSTIFTSEEHVVTEQIITGAQYCYFVGIERTDLTAFTFRNVRILDKAIYDINSLDGSIITAKSITATKISVDDLVAFDATIGGFNITKDSIYSGVKESVDNTTRGVYLDKEGQFAVGDSNNYLKYYKDSEGKYRLAISADSLEFSSSNTIGGRNLYLGTRNFDGDKWTNLDQWETWDSDGFGYVEYGRYGAWLGLGQYIEVKAGETYTFSFYARGNENAEITIYTTQNHTETSPGSKYIGPIPDEYIRYHFTFTVNEDCTIYPRVENMTEEGWIQIYGLKLERGSVATDWSPAPEDAENDIQEAAKTASNFMSYDSTNGLQVGNKTTGTWTGFRTQITNAAFNILDAAGNALASYGAKIIELGKNATDAIIKLCGGKGQIEYVTDEDDNESYLQIKADKLRMRGAEMASVYSAYTDDSTRWEKSATNITPTKIHMYASECIDPTMQDMLEGWNTADVIVQPDYVYIGSPLDIDVAAGGDVNITTQLGHINLIANRINDSFGEMDSVITGSSGIWTYRKYVTGDVELQGIYNVSNKACNTTIGGWYRTDAFGVGSFPFPVYNAALTASYESAGYGAVLWATSVTSSTQPPSYYLIRPTSATIASGKIIIHVRGKWMQ